MTPPYAVLEKLASRAAAIRGGNATARLAVLPALWVLTDPHRTPDLRQLADGLPPGSALVYRHFGAPDRVHLVNELARICASRDASLFVSADPELHDHPGLSGIHWPEQRLASFRQSRFGASPLMHTASAHSAGAIAIAQRAGLDAVLASTVFPSASPSAGRPMGQFAAASLARSFSIPVIALGGITQKNSPRLEGLGLAGLACVGAASGQLSARSAVPTRT